MLAGNKKPEIVDVTQFLYTKNGNARTKRYKNLLHSLLYHPK